MRIKGINQEKEERGRRKNEKGKAKKKDLDVVLLEYWPQKASLGVPLFHFSDGNTKAKFSVTNRHTNTLAEIQIFFFSLKQGQFYSMSPSGTQVPPIWWFHHRLRCYPLLQGQHGIGMSTSPIMGGEKDRKSKSSICFVSK